MGFRRFLQQNLFFKLLALLLAILTYLILSGEFRSFTPGAPGTPRTPLPTVLAETETLRLNIAILIAGNDPNRYQLETNRAEVTITGVSRDLNALRGEVRAYVDMTGALEENISGLTNTATTRRVFSRGVKAIVPPVLTLLAVRPGNIVVTRVDAGLAPSATNASPVTVTMTNLTTSEITSRPQAGTNAPPKDR